MIVASDGSTDRTVELARKAGADLVLELPRTGKLATQNAGAAHATGDVLAFSDANATWQRDALRKLVAPFAADDIGYACGQVRFLGQGGSNQEGAYWRFELWRASPRVRPGGDHGRQRGDLRGPPLRIHGPRPGVEPRPRLPVPAAQAAACARVYVPEALAEEKMVASNEGEFARKRRMMRGIYDEVVGDGMLSPRGYRPFYAFEIISHRVLRYATPLLHVIAFAANLLLLGEGSIYVATLIAQVGLLVAAALAPVISLKPLRLAQYYVLTTASIALGLVDRIRFGTPGAWDQAEGTR